MCKVIRCSEPKARKFYRCDGKEQIINMGYDIEEAMKQAKKCCDIQKGDKYEYQFNTDGGEVWSWRCCLSCRDIIIKHSLHDF